MYQAAVYQASLTGVSTLSVLNHVVPPSLKPRRSLWVPEVLKVSELLCAVSFSCLQQVTMFYSINKCFISVAMYRGLTLCPARCCARHRGPVWKSLHHLAAACGGYLWMICPLSPQPSSRLSLALLPRGRSCPPWPMQPQPSPLLPPLLGQLGSWTPSADDKPMFTPGASSCLFSRHDPLPGLLFSCPWSPFCLSNAAFPLHLRTWGMRFFCWEDEGAPSCLSFSFG